MSFVVIQDGVVIAESDEVEVINLDFLTADVTDEDDRDNARIVASQLRDHGFIVLAEECELFADSHEVGK